MLAKPQAESPPGTTPGCYIANVADLIPEPRHVSRGQHAERENDAGKISIHQRLVVNFLAAHRFDGENVRASLGAQFQRTSELLPGFAGPQLRRLELVADVGGRDAQRAGQDGAFRDRRADGASKSR